VSSTTSDGPPPAEHLDRFAHLRWRFRWRNRAARSCW
jgi:hypothetical protein